jgi:hypothetical protein
MGRCQFVSLIKILKSVLQVITNKNLTRRLQFLSLIKVLNTLIQIITDKKINGEMPICITDKKFKISFTSYY